MSHCLENDSIYDTKPCKRNYLVVLLRWHFFMIYLIHIMNVRFNFQQVEGVDSVTNGISGLEMSGSPECLSSSLEAEQR